MLKINFSFTDEFGQESTLTKTFGDEVLEVTDQRELLIEQFEVFMVCAGFTKEGLMEFLKERYSA